MTLVGGVLTGCAAKSLSGSASPAHTFSPALEPKRVHYGPDRSQFGEISAPGSFEPSLPVVVLIHGGGWEAGYTLDGLGPHAADLVSHGVAVWNIEYRALGNGGGWPSTFADVAAAVDALAGPVQRASGNRLDLNRVVALGHSAGGHLAVWLAGRPEMSAGLPGSGPEVSLKAIISLAPVLDLVTFFEQEPGRVEDLVGATPTDDAQRYVHTSPIHMLPVGIPVTCIHGSDDETVPVAQSEEYVRAALQLGDPARLEVLSGVNHNAVIELDSEGWSIARQSVLSALL